jgi:hypothetical protein
MERHKVQEVVSQRALKLLQHCIQATYFASWQNGQCVRYHVSIGDARHGFPVLCVVPQ